MLIKENNLTNKSMILLNYPRLFSSSTSSSPTELDNTRQESIHFHNSSDDQQQQQQQQLKIKSTINSEDFAQLGLYLFSSWFWYNQIENFQDNFRSYLQSIHIKNDDLVLLCLHSLLSIPLNLPNKIQIWKEIFTIIYSINDNKNLIKTIIEKTNNALTALLLTFIFRLVDQDNNLSLLIRRLSALIAVQNLYLSINNNEQDQSMNQFTVETIFIKHRHDYLLELITRKIVEGNIQPSWLTITSTNSTENTFQSKFDSYVERKGQKANLIMKIE